MRCVHAPRRMQVCLLCAIGIALACDPSSSQKTGGKTSDDTSTTGDDSRADASTQTSSTAELSTSFDTSESDAQLSTDLSSDGENTDSSLDPNVPWKPLINVTREWFGTDCPRPYEAVESRYCGYPEDVSESSPTLECESWTGCVVPCKTDADCPGQGTTLVKCVDLNVYLDGDGCGPDVEAIVGACAAKDWNQVEFCP